MKRIVTTRWMAAAALVLAPCLAGADTIFFKDGTSLDGKVSQPHPNIVRLDFESGHMVFPASSVLRIEENDRMGVRPLRVNPHTERHNERMREKTGLTGDEQAELFQLMRPLNSEDSAERNRAVQAILAVAEEKDIVDFLAHVTTSTTERYLPQMLDILGQVDPARAREVSESHLTQQHPANRGAALSQLARTAGAEVTPTLAQGLVDHDPEVQVTAAQSIGLVGAREATPALLAALQDPDLRVRTASEQALQRLWGVNQDKSPQEWQAHWNQNQASVSSPINPAALEPLVEEEDPLTTTAYHE